MILIAGGTGRLGTLLATRLVRRGLPVRVLTRDPARAAHLAALGAEVVTGDVRDPATLEAAVRGADVVVSAVHGFGGPGGVSPATVDYLGNVNLIDAAQMAGADVVLMSVVGAAADSAMELHRMKHAAERHLLGTGTRWTIVRATAFLELWIDVLNQTAARSGRPLVFGRGTNPVNFVSVADVAALTEQVITDPESRGKIFEIGGPDDLTFSRLADAVQTAAGRSGRPRRVPRSILRLAAGTLGRIRPAAGRQIRAALFMDAADLRFGSGASRDHYPGIPLTSLSECLSSGATIPARARP
jgi:NADH dehydrogenase